MPPGARPVKIHSYANDIKAAWIVKAEFWRGRHLHCIEGSKPVDGAAASAELARIAEANYRIEVMDRQALIVIDLQNDFCPGGALPVAGGHEIVPLVNDLIQRFDHIILTQDWHPAGHSSFASTHPGKQPFETVQMPYGGQTLWPDHCIQGSSGAAFHPALQWAKAEMVIRKGFRTAIDSYSAFFENDHATPTGLAGYLRERGIEELTLVGLATDYCVAYSALDAVQQGFHTTVRLDACRAIDLGGSLKQMTETMREAGVRLV
jgi:nicotinamidase/pyrazinamidase